MPFVQISLIKGKSPDYVSRLADGIHEALRTAWGIPEHDRFQLIHEHEHAHFLMDRQMWDVHRSDDLVVIYITSVLRTLEMKKAFYAEVVRVLGRDLKLRPEDVFVSIVDNQKENWSFGNGIAQLL